MRLNSTSFFPVIALCTLLTLVPACSKQSFKGSTPIGAVAGETKTTTVTPSEDSIISSEPAASGEFGTNEIYRIGDGETSGECVAEVSASPLKGNVYNFVFRVINDDTRVDFVLGKLCGVGNPDGTKISLIDDSSKLIKVAEMAIPKDAGANGTPNWSGFPSATLAKGTYALKIRSVDVRVSPTNLYDDFIVGNIKVNSDKLIKIIEVRPETN